VFRTTYTSHQNLVLQSRPMINIGILLVVGIQPNNIETAEASFRNLLYGRLKLLHKTRGEME